MENEIVLFETEDHEVKLNVPVENNTVWLNRKQLAELFGRDVKTIGKHINNALKEELDNSVVANFATTASDGKVYQVEHYNLDMIISVGYRVKSRRGVEFRRWANDILKQYILNGCAINEKRLIALEKTVDIQTKMLACTLEVEEEDILKAVSLYTEALTMLDQYDHQTLYYKRYVIEDNLNAIVCSVVRQLLDMTDSFKKKLDKQSRISRQDNMLLAEKLAGLQQTLSVMKKYSDAEKLTQKIVQELIDKIIVMDPEHVEIVWKFKDEVRNKIREFVAMT